MRNEHKYLCSSLSGMESWVSIVKKGIQDRKFVTEFFTKYKDITFYLGISLSDILNLSLSCKKINVLLCSDQFWGQRYLQDFGKYKEKFNLKQAYNKYIRHNMKSYIYVVGVTSNYRFETQSTLCPIHNIYFTFDRKKAIDEAKKMKENIPKFYEHGCKACYPTYNPEYGDHYAGVNVMKWDFSCKMYLPIEDSDTEDQSSIYDQIRYGMESYTNFINFLVTMEKKLQ